MLRCFENGKNDTFQIFQYVVIGETQHAITARYEPLVATFIVADTLFEIVAFAIELNDKLAGMGDEIRDVMAHGRLTAKAKTHETISLEVTPQQRLRASHGATEFLGTAALEFGHLSVRH